MKSSVLSLKIMAITKINHFEASGFHYYANLWNHI